MQNIIRANTLIWVLRAQFFDNFPDMIIMGVSVLGFLYFFRSNSVNLFSGWVRGRRHNSV